jgi:hypothetical protein
VIGNLSRRGNSPCNSQHARNTHTSRKGLLLVTGPYRLSTDHTHAPRGKDVPARTRWACKHAQSSVRALAAVRTTRRPGRPAGGARARAPVRWSLTPSVRYVYLARSLASFRAQLSSNYTQSTRARRAPGGRLTQGQADESIEQRLNGGEGPLRHPATCCAPPRPSSEHGGGGREEESTVLYSVLVLAGGSGDVFDTGTLIRWADTM